MSAIRRPASKPNKTKAAAALLSILVSHPRYWAPLGGLTVFGLFVFACSGARPAAAEDGTGSSLAPKDTASATIPSSSSSSSGTPTIDGNCEAPLSACDDHCFDLSKSNAHCGTCETTCGKDADGNEQACTLGSCITPAPCSADAPTRCDAVCTDTKTDRNHCGECNVVCKTGQVCQESKCITACGAGSVRCGESCVEPNASESHCGATQGCGENGVGSAGIACTANQSCFGGQCVGDCSAGMAECSGQCTTIESDNANCGSCGKSCGAGKTCTHRVCCPTGFEACMGVCKNTSSDPNACGSCGVQCTPGQACVNGGCQ